MHIPKEFQYFNNLRLVFWYIASFHNMERTDHFNYFELIASKLLLFIHSLCMCMPVAAMLVCLGATAWMWHNLGVSVLSIMLLLEIELRLQGLVARILTCDTTSPTWVRTLNYLFPLMVFIKNCTFSFNQYTNTIISIILNG